MKRITLLIFLIYPFVTRTIAENQKFIPIIDGYISQQGDGGDFSTNNMVLKRSSNYERELYLTFDISKLHINGKSAFLRIYCNSFDKNRLLGISVAGFKGAIPQTLKWSTRMNLPAMTLAGAEKNITQSDTNMYCEWNVSDFVKKMQAENISIFSFKAYVSTGSDGLLKFYSKENDIFKPELEIKEAEVSPQANSIKLSRIFDNHMVLQRSKKVKIWGKANPHKEIKLLFNGQKKVTTTDESGSWKIILDKMSAGGPYNMKIISEIDTIRLTDILVGDVYLAGGQSNMAFKASELTPKDREELAHDIDYPNIRYYDVAKIVSGGVLLNELDRPWTICKNSNVDEWSAIATYFARQIHIEEGVPIGIIGCNQGGSTADAWISSKAYNSDVKLNGSKIRPYTSILKYYCNPSTLYEAMLKKVIGYQLNGIIWYQGEANTNFADKYEITFKGLIKDWRKAWNDENLPFIFAQLSSYKPTDKPEGDNWAIIREAQLKTWQNTNKTAMVITIDVGDVTNIHPTNKKTVGARFSIATQKLVYNKNIESSGPIFSKVSYKKSSAIISFSHAVKGLKSVRDTLSEFEICGKDFLYKPAKGIIVENKVKVWSDSVPKPIAVRYSWRNGPQPMLYNKEGLPASPFRSLKKRKLQAQPSFLSLK